MKQKAAILILGLTLTTFTIGCSSQQKQSNEVGPQRAAASVDQKNVQKTKSIVLLIDDSIEEPRLVAQVKEDERLTFYTCHKSRLMQDLKSDEGIDRFIQSCKLEETFQDQAAVVKFEQSIVEAAGSPGAKRLTKYGIPVIVMLGAVRGMWYANKIIDRPIAVWLEKNVSKYLSKAQTEFYVNTYSWGGGSIYKTSKSGTEVIKEGTLFFKNETDFIKYKKVYSRLATVRNWQWYLSIGGVAAAVVVAAGIGYLEDQSLERAVDSKILIASLNDLQRYWGAKDDNQIVKIGIQNVFDTLRAAGYKDWGVLPVENKH